MEAAYWNSSGESHIDWRIAVMIEKSEYIQGIFLEVDG